MRIAPAVAAAALAVATLASPAAASTSAAYPCGYFKQGAFAYYNHCAPDGTHVMITVKARFSGDHERCVGPGVTHIGYDPDVTNAWYNGKLC